MTEAKMFKGAPFGTQMARFDVNGVHPRRKMPGSFTELPYDNKFTNELARKLGPGVYPSENKGFHPKAVEARAAGPGWARQCEMERMAAMPHLLHKDQWEEKRELKRRLGPGTYNIKDFLQILDEKPGSVRGICDGLSGRFGKEHFSITPGPGTYGKNGIPHTVIEEKAKKSTSTKGMLDTFSGSRSQLPVSCPLGPGTYEIEDPLETFLNKVTSIRGPYDMSSGDRNKPIVAGHFAAPRFASLGPGYYNTKSLFDEWNEQHRRYKGRFGKVAQYPQPPVERIYNSVLSQCPKEQYFPGPGRYDPSIPGLWPKPFNHKQPGFLSSCERQDRRSQRFFTGNFNPVGVGRYNIQKYEPHHQNGHESIFNSKTGGLSHNAETFLRERARDKDVPPAERNCPVWPQGLPCEKKRQHMYAFKNPEADPRWIRRPTLHDQH